MESGHIEYRKQCREVKGREAWIPNLSCPQQAAAIGVRVCSERADKTKVRERELR